MSGQLVGLTVKQILQGVILLNYQQLKRNLAHNNIKKPHILNDLTLLGNRPIPV